MEKSKEGDTPEFVEYQKNRKQLTQRIVYFKHAGSDTLFDKCERAFEYERSLGSQDKYQGKIPDCVKGQETATYVRSLQ